MAVGSSVLLLLAAARAAALTQCSCCPPWFGAPPITWTCPDNEICDDENPHGCSGASDVYRCDGSTTCPAGYECCATGPDLPSHYQSPPYSFCRNVAKNETCCGRHSEPCASEERCCLGKPTSSQPQPGGLGWIEPFAGMGHDGFGHDFCVPKNNGTCCPDAQGELLYTCQSGTCCGTPRLNGTRWVAGCTTSPTEKCCMSAPDKAYCPGCGLPCGVKQDCCDAWDGCKKGNQTVTAQCLTRPECMAQLEAACPNSDDEPPDMVKRCVKEHQRLSGAFDKCAFCDLENYWGDYCEAGDQSFIHARARHPFTTGADEGPPSEHAPRPMKRPAPSGCCVSTDNKVDCSSLVKFYQATGSKLNWTMDGTASLCTWGGVSCEGGRISQLDLANHQHGAVLGTLPTQIGLLTTLKAFTIQSYGETDWGQRLKGSLGGTIPTQVGHLSELRSLNLDNNQVVGTIPTEVGLLPALTDLYLSYNLLSGTIPEEITGLTRLEFIGARGGQPPDDIEGSALKSATTGNQLQALSGTIPDTLGSKLAKLFTLHLGGNGLSGTMPANICHLISKGNLSDGCQLDRNPFDCPLPPCGKFKFKNLKTCIATCIGPG